MIKNSFIFLDRLSYGLEQKIWDQGILDWQDFLNASSVAGISDMKKKFYDRRLIEASNALHRDDAMFFLRSLPFSEHYRLYDHFRDDCVFLDIETTGLSKFMNKITMIGMFDGNDTKIMVSGINLDGTALRNELSKYKLIVTFNGAAFDLPFIEAHYPGLLPAVPHIDLRPVCRRVGLTGGLKRIEKELGINREGVVGDLNGGDALTLWKMYKSTGDTHYLDILVKYNEEDVINLQHIADVVCKQIKEDVVPPRLLT